MGQYVLRVHAFARRFRAETAALVVNVAGRFVRDSPAVMTSRFEEGLIGAAQYDGVRRWTDRMIRCTMDRQKERVRTWARTTRPSTRQAGLPERRVWTEHHGTAENSK
jgi:hypothetical protein